MPPLLGIDTQRGGGTPSIARKDGYVIAAFAQLAHERSADRSCGSGDCCAYQGAAARFTVGGSGSEVVGACALRYLLYGPRDRLAHVADPPPVPVNWMAFEN